MFNNVVHAKKLITCNLNFAYIYTHRFLPHRLSQPSGTPTTVTWSNAWCCRKVPNAAMEALIRVATTPGDRKNAGLWKRSAWCELSYLQAFVAAYLQAFVAAYLQAFVAAYLQAFVAVLKPWWLPIFKPWWLPIFKPSWLPIFKPLWLPILKPLWLPIFKPLWLPIFKPLWLLL